MASSLQLSGFKGGMWKQLFFSRLLGRARRLATNPARLLGQLNRARRLAKAHRAAFGGGYGHLRALFRMIRATARGQYRPATSTLVWAVAVVLYIISPIDLIPDFIIGIGWLDDAAFFLWVLNKIQRELDQFVEWERAHALTPTNPPAP